MNTMTGSVLRDHDNAVLRGKHAVVTGASRGIGATIASTLARYLEA